MSADETRDWVGWHREYDDPASRLSRRLAVVQDQLRRALDAHPGPVRIVSMCAGEGRDVISVLRDHPRLGEVRARLVEMDARIAGRAREAARAADLAGVDVVVADAGVTDAYVGAVPAEIVLACGVFGNITEADITRTIDHLPSLCAPGATVIWTRGAAPERDVAQEIRRWFNTRGFEEVAYVSPPGESFRVGVHRLVAGPRDLRRGIALFRFV
ncbi:MAG TPA: SAM-dependent methyltransferase [Dehalococcoidia bacterium]|nr:SAM-dependent methyltransferase [Dehalococcoidia bacterium]